jgi:hypothetical protein
VEGVILIVVAAGALLAFGAGIILLVLYFRSGREDDYQRQEPVRYGNLVQCPRCGYMNPADSAACLNCRLPFTHTRRPVPPVVSPNYPTIPPTSYQPPPARPAPPPQSYAPPSSGVTVPRQVQRTPPAASPPPPSAPGPAPAEPRVSAPLPPAGRPADMPNAWLEGIAGVIANQQVPLSQADMMVGRSTVCDVQIYDPKVSRKHFLIRFGNGAFFLQDQQSSRGTYINGERVMAQRLNNGDRIDLGDTSLVFHVE